MGVLIPRGEAAVLRCVGALVDCIERSLGRKLEHAGEDRHCQRVGCRSVHESNPPANGPMGWGVCTGSATAVPVFDIALQALQDLASGTLQVAFSPAGGGLSPQHWGIGARLVGVVLAVRPAPSGARRPVARIHLRKVAHRQSVPLRKRKLYANLHLNRMTARGF